MRCQMPRFGIPAAHGQASRHHRRGGRVLWALNLSDSHSANLVCTDGDGTVISTGQIAFSDFPLPENKFYVTNNTIILPSEY